MDPRRCLTRSREAVRDSAAGCGDNRKGAAAVASRTARRTTRRRTRNNRRCTREMYAQMGYTPDFGAQQNAAASAAAAVPVLAALAVGANPWRAIDDGKGNIYYYNALTGVSQWEKPDGFA